jgi:hypothetical protein
MLGIMSVSNINTGCIMKNDQAKEIARTYISKIIELEECTDPPPELYDFNATSEFLFTYRFDGERYVGGPNYITVSERNGEVSHLGRYGE